MQYQVLLAFIYFSGGCSDIVRILDIDPGAQGTCPSNLQLVVGIGGEKLCVRSSHPSSSVLVAARGVLAAAGHPKGLRQYSRLNGTLRAFQKGTTEAFDPGVRDGSGIDSSDYVDGISITRGSPRTHVFTFAVSASYDSNLGTGLCPCGPGTSTLVCAGVPAPSYLGSAFACDSGNYGSLSLSWEPREMAAHFDYTFGAVDDDVEVRLMCDQPDFNEDVGIAVLQIDAYEPEDHDPPLLQLLGSQNMSVLMDAAWNDPGATCTDGVDGPLAPNVSGTIDTSTPSVQSLRYFCTDLRGNLAEVNRTVTVLDTVLPTVAVRGNVRQCLLEYEPYAELGAECNDNVDGIFEANATGDVDLGTLGSYIITYTCVDSSQNVATATRRVVVVSSAFPGGLTVEHVELQTSRAGQYEAAGLRTILANVNPATDVRLRWSAAFALNPGECRFATLLEHSAQGGRAAVLRLESMLLNPADSVSGQQLALATTNATAGGGLKELTTYTLVVDEHFIQSVSGAGEGNVRQAVSFTTGKYSEPGISRTAPGPGELAFPTSRAIELTFSEAVQGSAGKHLNVTLLENSTVESIPCNGSVSSSGLQILFHGQSASIAMKDWALWRGCRDYRIEAEAGCFVDSSLNRNPTAALAAFQFVTSCVVALSPKHESVGVLATSPIVVTFAEPVQMGTGDLQLQPLGEEQLQLSALDFPMVYVDGVDLTIDLACRTARCRVYTAYLSSNASEQGEAAAPNASNASAELNASMGICTGRTEQQCKGKVHSVSIGPSALKLAHGHWPQHSLLSLADEIPAQLEGGGYRFTLKQADLTPPGFLHVDATATLEDSIRVRAHLNESGIVRCAAFKEWGDTPCTSLALLQEDSQGSCGNETRDDCTGCAPPSFGCHNRTAMWVDDGCAGTFRLHGKELVCQSWEAERTVYDGGRRSVLSLGRRHACAIRKLAADPATRCWGKADNIDPGTGSPPAVNLLMVSAGYMHTCGVTADIGQVLCWGVNQHGETAGPASASVQFAAVTSGYRFSCALRADTGEAECWGLNDLGQTDPPPGVSFLAISAGNRHACGIRRNDTTVQCWGWNSYGQGQPPAGVRFLARGPGGAALPEASLSAGWDHTCAISEDTGAVLCWGANTDGQVSAPSDGAAFVQVASGRAHTCGIHKALPGNGIEPNGTVRCWGLNDQGQASAPSGVAFSAIAADDDYTCGIRAQDNSLACWGRDDYGKASPPAAEAFGVLDEFEEINCSIDTQPGKQEVMGLSGERDAGASAVASRSPVTGYAEVDLELGGLEAQEPYWVYCFAEDEEFPTPNAMSEEQMFEMRRLVTTLDTSPPALEVVGATATSATAVAATVRLSEPGVAYCLAVMDREAPPSGKDVMRSGSRSPTGPDLVALVSIVNLSPDTEYNIYCTARDDADHGPGLLGNWVSETAVLRSRTNVHTLFDSLPPLMLARSPAHHGFFSCVPDGFAAGCMTAMDLTFNEDVRPGTGNISLTCMTNLGSCMDVVVPMEAPAFDGGSTFFENAVLHVAFSSPLVDASRFQVSISSGAVQDMDGNPFELDEECEPWFDKQWQTSPRPCSPAYVVNTPS